MAYTPAQKRAYWARKNAEKKNAVEPGSLYKPVVHPSEEQEKIFDAVLNTSDNLMIEAFAGCGKTTTCVESMHRSFAKTPNLKQAYIIFAKRNQEEAVGKCPPSVVAKTAHSFGMSALVRKYGRVMLDNKKDEKISVSLVGNDEEKEELRSAMNDAMDLAKGYLAATPEEIDFICDKHGIDTCNMPMNEFADKVLAGMELAAKQPNVVSYSDMVWLPIKLNLKIQTFDVIYADECQDLNRARFELVFRAIGKRLVSVGDKNQALFSFSGSDRHSLVKLIERSNATRLPLHKTFRCAKAIVQEARQFVSDFTAADTNPEGEIRQVSRNEMESLNGAAPGDFILSRTNAPLMKYAMRFLKEGRRCNIQGRDIGKNLLSMIRRSKTKDVVSFQRWLDDWAAAEIERLDTKKRNYEHILDKKECFEVMMEGRRSMDDVQAHIKQLFDDDDNESVIMGSTIHRAKGLERNRVWLLEESFVIRPKTEEEQEAERNVRYVAITRAKNSLFYVR